MIQRFISKLSLYGAFFLSLFYLSIILSKTLFPGNFSGPGKQKGREKKSATFLYSVGYLGLDGTKVAKRQL